MISKHPEYNEQGKVRCNICGQYFDRVMNHARLAHGISNKQYRKKFGYSNSTNLTSIQSSMKSGEKIKIHYHNGDYDKFIERSKSTRFVPGIGSLIFR